MSKVADDRAGVIYGIRARVGDQYLYVGQSVNLKKRARTHLQLAKQGSPLPVHQWIARLGGAVEFEVLEECVGPQALNEAEVRWIARLRAEGMPLTNGTDGGMGGPTRQPDYESEEWRRAYEQGMTKRRTYRPDAAHVERTLGAYVANRTEAEKSSTYAKVSEKLKGHPKSLETRAKMSEAQRARRAREASTRDS